MDVRSLRKDLGPHGWVREICFTFTLKVGVEIVFLTIIFKKHVVFKKQSTRWFTMAGKKQLSNEKTLVV